jgi:hypothetical protein
VNLLDVNLLIALCDADHQHHAIAKAWFKAHSAAGWATCPLTENGLLRVMGSPSYPDGPGSSGAVLPLLKRLRTLPGHQFWPDAVSLADAQVVPSLADITPKQLTDLYLLALAVSRGGRLVTLDAKIDPARVPYGSRALWQIG